LQRHWVTALCDVPIVFADPDLADCSIGGAALPGWLVDAESLKDLYIPESRDDEETRAGGLVVPGRGSSSSGGSEDTEGTDEIPDTWLREDLVIHSQSVVELWLDCLENSVMHATSLVAASLWIVTWGTRAADDFSKLSPPLNASFQGRVPSFPSENGTSSIGGTVATHPRDGEGPWPEAPPPSAMAVCCGL
jgi:hypothetical protein